MDAYNYRKKNIPSKILLRKQFPLSRSIGKVYSSPGPGLLENLNEKAMAYELKSRDFNINKNNKLLCVPCG